MLRFRKPATTSRFGGYAGTTSIVGGAVVTATALAMSVAVPPAEALTVPVFGEIPGTEAIALDAGEVIAAFGGKQWLDLAEAAADGDLAALVTALNGAELVALAEAIAAGDLEGAVRALDGDLYVDAVQAIGDGDWVQLLDLVDRDADGNGEDSDLAEFVVAVQEGDLGGAVASLGGEVLVRIVTGVRNGTWLEVLDALDRDADGDGRGDSRLKDLVQAVQAGDIVTIADIFGAFDWLTSLGLLGPPATTSSDASGAEDVGANDSALVVEEVSGDPSVPDDSGPLSTSSPEHAPEPVDIERGLPADEPPQPRRLAPAAGMTADTATPTDANAGRDGRHDSRATPGRIVDRPTRTTEPPGNGAAKHDADTDAGRTDSGSRTAADGSDGSRGAPGKQTRDRSAGRHHPS